MSFLARLLRRWGFIRLQDYGLVLTDDNRVIPAADLGHAFEPPSWCSVAVPIGPAEQVVSALPPIQQNYLPPAAPEVTLSAAAPPPPSVHPRPESAPGATTAPSARTEEQPVDEQDEWQWKMALARAKAAEQSLDPPKVDETADFAPTDFDPECTAVDQPTTAPERPAVKHTPAAVLPMRPAPAPTRRPAPTWGAGRKPIRARGTGAPPLHLSEPRPMKSIPRPTAPKASTEPVKARKEPAKARKEPPKARQEKPVSDATRPDLHIADFSDHDATADQTIPSMPATLEDTQVELRAPARDAVLNAARQRPRAALPEDDKPLPRLSAILDKRSAG